MEYAAQPLFGGLKKQVQDRTGPEPKPGRSPVFIQDAITPWGDETMLLALIRAQQKASDQDE